MNLLILFNVDILMVSLSKMFNKPLKTSPTFSYSTVSSLKHCQSIEKRGKE